MLDFICFMKRLAIIILAAGKGKRMRSHLPKVLHPLANRPLLAHVVDLAKGLNPERIIVVIGHGAERIREVFTPPASPPLQGGGRGGGEVVEKKEQLGAGPGG